MAEEIPIMVQIERVAWQAANARIAALEAENADLRASINEWREIASKLATFGDPASADLPPPVLRPDGTLAPQPKPLPVLKNA